MGFDLGLNLLHLNIHGLIRSRDLELGRDADTGGQTLYVLELIKGLALRPEVDQVSLVTRLIQDRRVSDDYSQAKEFVAPSAEILRFSFGPKRYIRKELLWPYLDELADKLVQYLSDQDYLPDWIHAHYADAGYVGSLVSQRLGIPLVFTGHSLGRDKQRRLLAAGVDYKQIEQNYSISRRIDAEEFTLSHADLVITSTQQEVDSQYSRYSKFTKGKAIVVPPGVDSKRFHSSNISSENSYVDHLVGPFLRDPNLPPLLTISRAVRRKNIPALIEAYGRSSVLRKRHNLVLILGCREDATKLEKQQRDVFQQIFELVDRYDLYGKIAYPKYHTREQIPWIYRWAANKNGLFINPALTEPFGLTLLEAASCGLPMVATDDGGPRDILSKCENGSLVDVTDLESFQDSLEQAGSNKKKWQSWRNNGIEAVSRHFSWDAHVCNYLALSEDSLQKRNLGSLEIVSGASPSIQPLGKRILLLDLDSALENSQEKNILNFRRYFQNLTPRNDLKLGIMSGRSIKAARYRYAELNMPSPAVWISRAGTEIYYGNENHPDSLWDSALSLNWDRSEIKNALADLSEHLILQSDSEQSKYKISYSIQKPDETILPLVRKRLRQQPSHALPFLKCHWVLDVLPLRGSHAEAIRHLSLRWAIPLTDIYVVASEQGDDRLIRGLTKSIIPVNHDSSLDYLRSHQNVYFANSADQGIIEGLRHFRFFSEC